MVLREAGVSSPHHRSNLMTISAKRSVLCTRYESGSRLAGDGGPASNTRPALPWCFTTSYRGEEATGVTDYPAHAPCAKQVDAQARAATWPCQKRTPVLESLCRDARTA